MKADVDFDGETFDQDRDGLRLQNQQFLVWNIMRDGHWRTLHDIARAINQPEASVSARLRDLRKPKYGSHTIEREYLTDGIWQYRLKKEDRAQ